MNILLISYDNDNSIAYFPLGLGYLAAAIRDSGHYVEIYQQDVYHYPVEHLTDFLDNHSFDVVGLGACGGYYQYDVVKRNIKAIKNSKNNPILILGGHLPSPEPEFFLRKLSADFVIIGEGERTVVELLYAMEHKLEFDNIKSLAYIDEKWNYHITPRREPIEDVDSITRPAYDLFNMEQYVLHPATYAAKRPNDGDVKRKRMSF